MEYMVAGNAKGGHDSSEQENQSHCRLAERAM